MVPRRSADIRVEIALSCLAYKAQASRDVLDRKESRHEEGRRGRELVPRAATLDLAGAGRRRFRGHSMELNEGPRWEIQWHPASGGRVRRLVFTWRAARRGIIGLGLVTGLAIVSGASHSSRRSASHHPPGSAAFLESRELRVQHEALRLRAFDLARRSIDSLERERQRARSSGLPQAMGEQRSPRLPESGVADELLLAWLSAQERRLANLELSLRPSDLSQETRPEGLQHDRARPPAGQPRRPVPPVR